MYRRLKQYLSSTELKSIFLRLSDNAILVSEGDGCFYIDGKVMINASHRDLVNSEHYDPINKILALKLVSSFENNPLLRNVI